MDASRGFEVELRRVGVSERSTDGRVSSGSSRRPVAAWLLLLVSVAGAAGIGRVAGDEPDQPSVVSAGATDGARLPAAGAGEPSGAAALIPLPEMIVLSSPATANAVITTRELAVRGYLATGSGTLQVTLEARGNRIIDSATIAPSLIFGERPSVGRQAQFETRFGLPNPRPNGRMIVQVTLIDESGQIVDVIRRPVRVGPLLEGAAGA